MVRNWEGIIPRQSVSLHPPDCSRVGTAWFGVWGFLRVFFATSMFVGRAGWLPCLLLPHAEPPDCESNQCD
jgi:hypothetical protein